MAGIMYIYVCIIADIYMYIFTIAQELGWSSIWVVTDVYMIFCPSFSLD